MTEEMKPINKIIIKGIAPLLQVFDMPASVAFYHNILGFEIIEQVPTGDNCDWALLRLNQVEIMLNTAYERHERPSLPDPTRIESHGDTILFFNCPDVDAAYRYIVGNGFEVKEPDISHYGYKSINITDPDGYKLCFHWPNS